MLRTTTGVLLRAYGLTDRGRVRPTNQDCFAIREALGLLVIADGMGGHNGGEIAARLAVDAVVDFVGASTEGTGEPVPDDLQAWPLGFHPTPSAHRDPPLTAVSPGA